VNDQQPPSTARLGADERDGDIDRLVAPVSFSLHDGAPDHCLVMALTWFFRAAAALVV
jgi:hypothetical protein